MAASLRLEYSGDDTQHNLQIPQCSLIGARNERTLRTLIDFSSAIYLQLRKVVPATATLLKPIAIDYSMTVLVAAS